MSRGSSSSAWPHCDRFLADAPHVERRLALALRGCHPLVVGARAHHRAQALVQRCRRRLRGPTGRPRPPSSSSTRIKRVGEVAHLARRGVGLGTRHASGCRHDEIREVGISPGRAGGSGIPNRSGTASVIDSPVTVRSSARPNNRVERYRLSTLCQPLLPFGQYPLSLGRNRNSQEPAVPESRPRSGLSYDASVRVIIFGAGAVGSMIGGRLRQSGADVVLVARPAHATAINERGLTLRTAKGSEVVEIDAVTSIDQLTPTGRRHRDRHRQDAGHPADPR